MSSENMPSVRILVLLENGPKYAQMMMEMDPEAFMTETPAGTKILKPNLVYQRLMVMKAQELVEDADDYKPPEKYKDITEAVGKRVQWVRITNKGRQVLKAWREAVRPFVEIPPKARERKTAAKPYTTRKQLSALRN